MGYLRAEDGEEIPRAFVVPQAGEDGAPVVGHRGLMEWVAERVAPYKKVRLVEIIDEIPKSGTGKILRKNLRDVPVSS